MADFRSYARNNPAGWRRVARPDHFTASVLVMDPGRTQVLLGLHRRVGRWLQFGGHIEDSDDSLAGAALREASEECGLQALTLATPLPIALDRHAAPCAQNARYHLDIQFAAFGSLDGELEVSDELVEVAWFPVDQLPTGVDRSVLTLVTEALTLKVH